MSTEGAREKALPELARAIAAFFEAVEPGVYVDGWVLVTHKRSTEWEQDDSSAVGVTTPPQAWPLTRGMLDIALEQERIEQATT